MHAFLPIVYADGYKYKMNPYKRSVGTDNKCVSFFEYCWVCTAVDDLKLKSLDVRMQFHVFSKCNHPK